MEISTLPEQHGRHCPRLRNRMVERPHQFLVVEDRLGFSKRCPTSVTGGDIEKILCPTVRTVLYERHGSFPFRCMHIKKSFYNTTYRVIEAINPSGYLSRRASSPQTFMSCSIPQSSSMRYAFAE